MLLVEESNRDRAENKLFDLQTATLPVSEHPRDAYNEISGRLLGIIEATDEE